MLVKYIIKIFIIIFLIINTACDYRPIYSKKILSNLIISEIKYEGNSTVNKFLKSQLIKFVDNKNKNEFKLIVQSNYSKEPISRNISGNITNYEIKVSTNIEIKRNLKNNKLIIERNFQLKALENKFEEAQYVDTIIGDLSTQIVNELIINLLNYDNKTW